jgi:hypothetical protein
VIFAPQTANICTLYRKSSVKPPGYAAESSKRGEKVPELWLRRNALDALFPWPVLDGILGVRERAGFVAGRAG